MAAVENSMAGAPEVKQNCQKTSNSLPEFMPRGAENRCSQRQLHVCPPWHCPQQPLGADTLRVHQRRSGRVVAICPLNVVQPWT